MNIASAAAASIFANPDKRAIDRASAQTNQQGKGGGRAGILNRCGKNLMQRALRQSALKPIIDRLCTKCHAISGNSAVVTNLLAQGAEMFWAERANHNVLIMFYQRELLALPQLCHPRDVLEVRCSSAGKG